MGMTDDPSAYFQYLDASDVWPVLHLWIRTFYFFWNIYKHLNARKHFPKRTPTMRGQKKGPFITEKVEEARQNLIKEARKKPIKMLVDSPDPHGEFLFTLFTIWFYYHWKKINNYCTH